MKNGAPGLYPGADPDRSLVERFQRGSDREGAIVALFDRHGPTTLGFFRRRVGDPEIAAELNQELFLSVIKHLDGFRGEASFRSWLFRLAHNQLHHLRRRWRVHLDEVGGDLPDELWQGMASDNPGADEEQFAEQRDRLLRRCLAQLEEVERAVIIGQYYLELTLRELTEELKLTNPSGARAKLIAGQRKLKRCLERSGLAGASG